MIQHHNTFDINNRHHVEYSYTHEGENIKTKQKQTYPFNTTLNIYRKHYTH